MADGARSIAVTVTQMRATGDVAANLAVLAALVRAGAEHGSDLVVLPEYALHAGSPAAMRAAGLTLASDPVRAVAALAREFGLPVLLGGVKLLDETGRVANSALAFDERGETFARYDKIHLFEATVAGTRYAPTDRDRAGDRPMLFELAGATIGVTICFDLRFPNLFRHLADAGADLVLVPSSFTRVTGRAHWSTLLRARAIDNQLYVVASATIGAPDLPDADPLATWGHALAVGPWGDVLADLGTAERAAETLTLSLAEIQAVRTKLPIRAARRAFDPR